MSRDITFRNCKVYNIKSTCLAGHNNGDWRSAHAFLVIGDDNGTPIRNLTIEKCEIYDMHTGTSETLTIAGMLTVLPYRIAKYMMSRISVLLWPEETT